MWFKYLLVLIILLVFSWPALAAENAAAKEEKEEKDTAKLQEVVVTATRTEKEAAEAPGTVKVVTQKDIEKSPALTVDSALNTVPGLFNRRVNLMDTLASVTLGGVPGQNRTLILKDGIPLNTAYTGDVSLTAMSNGDVKRIEVVQGPFSSLYGGNAMGGVVNILTKMPEKREFTAQSGYGTSWNRGESLDDLQTYYVSYGDKPTDKLRMLLSYGYKATNGYSKDMVTATSQPTAGISGWSRTTSNTGATRYLIGDKGDNTWWDDSLDVKLGYDLSSNSRLNASVLRTRYRYNYDEPHTYLTNASGNPVYSYGSVRESSFCSGSGYTETTIYGLNLENEIGIAKTKLTLALNDQGENWYTTPNTTSPYATLSGLNGKVSSSPNQTWYADLQATLPVFNWNILTMGGTFRTGRSNTEEHSLVYYKDETTTTSLTYNSGGKDKTYSVFAQDEILLHEKLTAYVGFRQDWWKTFDGYANQFGTGAFAETYGSRTDSSFSPKASLVFRPFGTTTLRSSIGRAFRAPTIYELYRTWVSSTNITYKGNPDLKPETTTSWDVGISQGLWKGASVSATYFDNHLKNLIYRKTVTSTLSEYINAGKAESRGVILEAEQKFDKWLKVLANFTYTNAKIDENEAKPSTVGKRLTYLPEKMFNVGADLEAGPFSASVVGRYVSKRYTDDENLDVVNNVPGSYDPFFTGDAKVAWKVCKNATVSCSVLNIADEFHYESYRAPRRMWLGELELRF
ncbi:MAG: TonB-dependent receptor [Syntrophaceae bacterium]